jgi:hypothetical protein
MTASLKMTWPHRGYEPPPCHRRGGWLRGWILPPGGGSPDRPTGRVPGIEVESAEQRADRKRLTRRMADRPGEKRPRPPLQRPPTRQAWRAPARRARCLQPTRGNQTICGPRCLRHSECKSLLAGNTGFAIRQPKVWARVGRQAPTDPAGADYRVIRRPALAEIVGDGRPWTVLMISLLSMPWR